MKKLLLLVGLFALAGSLVAQDVEVGFAAKGTDPTAKALVLKVIASAKTEIRMEAYNFTDADIIAALVKAKDRGVDVKVVHDAKAAAEKGDGTGALKAAGIEIRLNSHYAIMHDKVIVVDQTVVETGSYNYSGNANKENAENVIVLWARPDIAKVYLARWAVLFAEGK